MILPLSELTSNPMPGASQVIMGLPPTSTLPSVQPGHPGEETNAGCRPVSTEVLLSYGNEFPELQLHHAEHVHCMVQEMASVGRVPYEFVFAACLGAYSAACGTGIEVMGLRGKRSRANLYLVVGANPSVGKSDLWGIATGVLYSFERELVDNWKHDVLPAYKAKKDQLDEQIKKAKRATPEEAAFTDLASLHRQRDEIEARLVPPQLLVEDATGGSLEKDVAAAGEVLTLISLDGRAVVENILGRHDPRHKPVDDVYVKLWSGDPFRTYRLSREPVILERPCLSINVAVQPDKLKALYATPELHDSGFLQRILPAPTNAKLRHIEPEEPGVNREILDRYENHLRRTLELLLIPSKQRGYQAPVLSIAPEGLELLRTYANECIDFAEGPLSDLSGFVMRWAENAIRVALCLHVMIWGHAQEMFTSIVTKETISLAIRIQRWYAAKQLSLLQEGREAAMEKRKDRLVNILNGLPGRERSVSELKTRNGIEEPDINLVVGRYPELFEIDKTVPGTQGGRPSVKVRLKPMLDDVVGE